MTDKKDIFLAILFIVLILLLKSQYIPENMVLKHHSPKRHLPNYAFVITDPQNDFLSDRGCRLAISEK